MKVLPDLHPTDLEAPAANTLILPQGLIGFEQYKRAELLYQAEQLPFIWLRLIGPSDTISFIVIEPGGIIPGYEPELFEQHAVALGLTNSSEAMLLNIVTLKHKNPLEATVNLIGPIVINRRTRKGLQVVVSNYSRYSTNYALVENAPVAGHAAAR